MKAKAEKFQKRKYSYDGPKVKRVHKDSDHISLDEDHYCLFCNSTENVRNVNGNNVCYSCYCYLKTAVTLNERKAYEDK